MKEVILKSKLTEANFCSAGADEEHESIPYAHSDCVKETDGTYTARLHIGRELFTRGGFLTYTDGTVWALRLVETRRRQEFGQTSCQNGSRTS